MAITTDKIKELREKTSAGMLDCKKALQDAAGDFEKAVEILRKKGIASATKRAGKEAKEGLIGLDTRGAKGVMVELNCETDFVARTDGFRSLLARILKQTLNDGEKAIESEEIKTAVAENSGSTGEKLELKRAVVLEAKNGFVSGYLHSNHRVGVLIEVEGNGENAELHAAARDAAMQVAAMRPVYVDRKTVASEWLEKEKEILRETSKEALKGKPEQVQEKILTGKLNKRYEEVCLLDQKFIKDDKQTVGKFLEAAAKKAGSPLVIKSFIRYELGSN